MIHVIIAWLDSLGIRGLTFDVSYREALRLLWASAMPAVVLLTFLAELGLGFGWGIPYEFPQDELGLKAYLIVSSLNSYGGYLGLAILIFISVAGVTRGMASFSILFAVGFMALALTATFIGTLPYLFFEPYGDSLLQDVHIDLFQRAVVSFGITAAGYSFMAFSGLPIGEDADEGSVPQI